MVNRNSASMVRGFTLLELLITLSILSLLATFALPSFTLAIDKNRSREAGRQLLGSINYARSNAIFLRKHVTLCASLNQSTCNSGSSWNSGGIIFIDSDKDGQRSAGEKILQLIPAAPQGSRLQLNGGLQDKLRFQPNGRLTATGNYTFCPAQSGAENGWVIIFFWTGRPYFGRDSNGDGIAENGSGNNLSC